MRQHISLIVSFFILVLTIYYALDGAYPHYRKDISTVDTLFSTDRALVHLKKISGKVHYCGTKAHEEVRDYLIRELKKLGLDVQIQKQEVISDKWKAGVRAANILARIKGKKHGKALLLLSHYDSAPSCSYGASDDGSGIVTILEGVRAFLAKHTLPENDIIILFSDAEELGLLGAEAFVKYHPWAKEVGLVINFEARGSGGPSYMLMETNSGNKALLKHLSRANIPYPVSNSLLYSIYKMLPNDTDLTVFREEADIPGVNFAFIDDFFDYHTAQDNYERMNKRTLSHNGSYLMSVLDYFSRHDLEHFESHEDYVFFNFPGLGLVFYPFQYVLPSVIVLLLIFAWLLTSYLFSGWLTTSSLWNALWVFLLSLALSLLIGILGWKFMLYVFPSFHDIMHGFPYQGKTLMFMFFSFTAAVIWKLYSKHLRRTTALSAVSVFFWILLMFLISFKLPGGGYFILIPLTAMILWVYAFHKEKKHKKYSVLVTLLFFIPVLIIFSPILTMFPVGLGMKAIAASLFVFVLIISSFWPLLSRFSGKLHKLFFLLAGVAFLSVMMHISYTPDKKKPTGAFYLYDDTSGKAYLGSYNHSLDSYISELFPEEDTIDSIPVNFYNKFKKRVHFSREIDPILLPRPQLIIHTDTIGNKIIQSLKLKSMRGANMFYITSDTGVSKAQIRCNKHEYSPDFKELKNTMNTQGRVNFLSYWLTSPQDSLLIEYSVNRNTPVPQWDIYEIKFDFSEHFDIDPRNSSQMPQPFVINDATIYRQMLK